MRTFVALSFISLLSMSALAGPPDEWRSGEPLSPALAERILDREAEILGALEAHAPDRHARLLELKDQDPDAYLRHLARAGRTIQHLRQHPELRENRMAQRDAKNELHELAETYKTVSRKEQEQIRAKMVEIGNDLFELKQEERRTKLAKIEAHLAELKAEIAEKEAGREDRINNFIDQMIAGDAEL